MTNDAPHATAGDDAPLSILIASDYYPPFIGGVQRQTRLLSHELARRGHRVEVATIWSPGCPEGEMDDGVPVHRLRQTRSLVRSVARPGKHHPLPSPDPVTVTGLRHVIARLQPDVVHTFGWFSYSVAAAMRGTSTPLVVSNRDYAHGCPTRTLIHDGAVCSGPGLPKCVPCAQRVYGPVGGPAAVAMTRRSNRLLAPRVSGLHSISAYVQDAVRRNFVDDRVAGIPHVVIPSFMSDEEFSSADDDPALAPFLDLLPREPFILFVGALRAVKGIGPLLEAYGRLTAPPLLVLMGTAETDTPSVMPPGVVVAASFPHAAVMASWRRALFGVAPSLLPEPLGSVVYEGMARGRAIIGTRPGGHTDMITDGRTGLLVPGGDVAALAGAMERLLASPAFRERLGAEALTAARGFTASRTLPQFEALYRDVSVRTARAA